jgi:hypothetical protein
LIHTNPVFGEGGEPVRAIKESKAQQGISINISLMHLIYL